MLKLSSSTGLKRSIFLNKSEKRLLKEAGLKAPITAIRALKSIDVQIYNLSLKEARLRQGPTGKFNEKPETEETRQLLAKREKLIKLERKLWGIS